MHEWKQASLNSQHSTQTTITNRCKLSGTCEVHESMRNVVSRVTSGANVTLARINMDVPKTDIVWMVARVAPKTFPFHY